MQNEITTSYRSHFKSGPTRHDTREKAFEAVQVAIALHRAILQLFWDELAPNKRPDFFLQVLSNATYVAINASHAFTKIP